MILKKFIPVFILLTLLVPEPARSEQSPSGSPFHMSAEALQLACSINNAMCENWIVGVLDGVEFYYLLAAHPEQHAEEPTIFCVDDEQDYVGEIREKFLVEIKKPENKDDLKKPAIFFIADSLRDNMCYARKREAAEN